MSSQSTIVMQLPIERVSTIEWMLIPLVLVLLSYALIRHSNGNIFRETLKQFFSFKLSNPSLINQSSRSSSLLVINAYIVASIILYKLFHEYVVASPYFLFGLILVGTLLFYIIKLLLVELVKTITESGELMIQARAYNMHYYKTIGIILLPGVIGFLLFPQKSNIAFSFLDGETINLGLLYCIVLLPILYIFKLLQSVRQSFDVKVSWYYIILYLCTLEILPLVVIYRLLVGKIWMFN